MKKFLALLMCFGALLAAANDTEETTVPVPKNWKCAPAGEQPAPGNDGTGWKAVRCFQNGTVAPMVSPGDDVKAVLYRVEMMIPVEFAGRNLELSLDRTSGDATVFLNGENVGMIRCPLGGLSLKGKFAAGEKNILELHVSQYNTKYVNVRDQSIVFSGISIALKPETRITDVFADTSFRKKNISFEIEITSLSDGGGELEFEIADESGKAIKKLMRNAEWKAGTTTLRTKELEWSDFIPWEVGKPYIYSCKTSLKSGGKTMEYPVFNFGFRELWTEGKDIVMNGHIQRFRSVYSFGANREGGLFLNSIGYNMIVFCHVRDIFPTFIEETLDAFDHLGIACSVPVPSLRFIGDGIHKEDSQIFQQYLNCMKYQIRSFRNHPSVCWAYVALLANGDHMQQYPTFFGQSPDRGSAARNIAEAALIARRFCPNILYHGFGDGNTGDIASAFAYLNWTPLQEREEWLSQWAEKGVMPIFFPEFGQPYRGNFWKEKAFMPTEYLAMYYGDDVYLKESDEAIDSLMETGLGNKRGHGCEIKPDILPLWYDFHTMFTRRTNFAWRGYGISGGMIYFNLGDAYGTPPGVNSADYGRYGKIPKTYQGGRPDWASPDYEVYRNGNQNFCGFLGGYPEHTAKDHSFRPGAGVEKQLVFIWDGPGELAASAEWTATLNGKEIASGKESVNLKTADIVKKKIGFKLPEVAVVSNGEIAVAYKTSAGEEQRDSFAFEVFPETGERISMHDVIVYDPSGHTTALLDKIGVKYRKIGALDSGVRNAKHLILGRFSLGKANLSFDSKDIENGLNVLIMAQMPDELKALGFRVEDRMARLIFLRDKFNPAFGGISDKTLSLWSGTPDYGTPYGNLTGAETTRFKHWRRTHTVASSMIQIPEHGGFLPLMDGEFDMNYSPLLRWQDGKGSITYCMLDLEDRPDTDPAPILAASAVLKDFLAERSDNSKSVAGEGADAEKLAAKAGFDPVKDADIIVLDKSSSRSWSEIRAAAEKGKSFLIYANKRIAAEAGFALKNITFRSLRKAVDNLPLLRGVGPSLLRYRSAVELEQFVSAPDGFTLLADGLIAESAKLAGKVVFVQLEPFALEEKYGGEKDAKQATFLSTERMIQLGARILTNMGAKPGRMTANRILHQTSRKDFEPLRSFFVIGPFDVKKDDGKLMLNTVFSVEGSAIRGYNAPEEEYPLPQGGTANWRTTGSSDENGVFKFRQLGGKFSECTHAVNYALHYFDRKSDQDAVLLFNVDWRAKIWCNGELVFMTENGRPGRPYEVKLTNLKKGRNYLAFKIGSGSFGCTMEAFITPEPTPDAIIRKADPELEAYKLYEQTFAPGWDAYQHCYW